MRRFLIILAPVLTLACFSSALPASAEEYPVCLAGGSANTIECEYASLAQCQASAAGGLGYCVTRPGNTENAYASYRPAKRTR